MNMTPPDEQRPAAPPPKAEPEGLVLRARPRRVVRFKRGVLIGAAAFGAVAVAGVAWMALSPRPLQLATPSDERPVSERRPPPAAVADLPADYGDAPRLGPPLPGDLGGPILERQRQLGIEPGDIDPEVSAADQAAEAERQRQAAQAVQAREAGVLAQTSARMTPLTATAERAAAEIAPDTALAVSPDHQSRMQDMIGRSATGGVYNPHALETPVSPWQVMAGSVIAASLLTGVNSDLPGLVVAQVTENVHDTVTGRTVLIPQGSRLVGSYDSVVAFGQSRALLVWQRIILPDGASIQIDNLPATDAAGYAGLEDRVDHHTWRLLRGIGMSTLLGVGTELSLGDSESDLVRAIRQSTQQSANQAGQQIVTRNLDIQPTIRIRPGWPLRVIVHKDLVMRPWQGP